MKDTLVVPERWTFKSRHVAEHFDAHVREQLPWYDFATTAVAFMARHYIQPRTRVYDLGCSTGNIGRAINATLTERGAWLVPVDASAEMLERYEGPGEPVCADMEKMEYEPHSLAIAFLALQFVPPHERAATLDRILTKTQPGGAVILVDRFLPDTSNYDADLAIARLTLDAKRQAGATPDEIIEKELSLVGSQRPLSLGHLRPYAPARFFQFGHFAGYLLMGAGERGGA